MGNNPRAAGGPMSETEMASTLDTLRGTASRPRLTEQISQKERYRILGEATLQAVRDDPAGFARRRIWAFLSFLFGQELVKNAEMWTGGEQRRTEDSLDSLPPFLVENLPLVFYGSVLVMLFLGFLGWRWTYAWRREGRLLALATIFIPLPYVLSHAETLVGPRLPLDGVLLTFAAYALACIIPGVGAPLFLGSEPAEDEEAVDRRLQEAKPHVRL
jgi:hypothetical protein